jgi:precorrin-2 dehydrogenase / sirohydrochlorin ferrochelatase
VAPGSDLPAPRFAYPVVLDLHDVAVLVVGGGRIGARKAEGLAAAGARVRLVATTVSAHVTDGDVGALIDEVVERPFEPSDLDGVRLVVTATGDPEVDAQVAAAARAQGIWANAADQPVDCEFILPAIARTGRVTVAISTDGASPALARELRNLVAAVLTADLGALAETLAGERHAIQDRGESTEDVDWTQRVRSGIEAALSPREPSGE